MIRQKGKVSQPVSEVRQGRVVVVSLSADLLNGQGCGPDAVVGIAVIAGGVLRQVGVLSLILQRGLKEKWRKDFLTKISI